MRKLRVIICSILFIIVCILSTGCTTTVESVPTQIDKCRLTSSKGISDLEFSILCINGVQYIKSGYGISAYWDKSSMGNPLLKSCTCEGN